MITDCDAFFWKINLNYDFFNALKKDMGLEGGEWDVFFKLLADSFEKAGGISGEIVND